MSFGTTLGGMGYSSVGMDHAAREENNRTNQLMLQQNEAMRMRMMQEQDAAAKAARARMDEYAKRTPGTPAPLPDATAGETPTRPAQPTSAPAATSGAPQTPATAAPTAPPAQKTDYAGPAAFYDDYAKEQEAKLAALKGDPDYQAKQDQATLKKLAARSIDSTALPLSVGRNAAVAVGKGVNKAVGAVTGKAGPLEKSEYSSLTPTSDSLPPSDEAQLTKGISEAKSASAKLKSLQGADSAKRVASSPITDNFVTTAVPDILAHMPQRSPIVTPELVTAVMGVENRSRDPKAVSPKGAFGVMQTIPATFDSMSKTYFGGVLDKTSGADQFAAGVAYLNHLASVELPRLGIPVTPENVLSAYQQGPGGLAKNGISAGVNDGITNNQQYVQKVMAGMGGAQTAAAPAGASQYPPSAAFQATSTGPAMSAPNTNQSMANYAETTKLLQMRVQNAYDPREKDAAILQLHAHNLSGQDMQIQNLQRMAANNPNAMNQLVGLFGGQNGAQYAVARDNKGNVQLVNADGSPVQGQLGLPMPAATLAANLGNAMRQDIQAQNAQVAALYSQSFAKHRGEADAKAPGEERLQAMKNEGNLAATQIHGENSMNVALIRAIEQSMSQGAPVPLPDGGMALWNHDGTASIYSPPTKNPTTGLPMYSPPQLIQQGHPMLAGMGQITAKVND